MIGIFEICCDLRNQFLKCRELLVGLNLISLRSFNLWFSFFDGIFVDDVDIDLDDVDVDIGFI